MNDKRLNFCWKVMTYNYSADRVQYRNALMFKYGTLKTLRSTCKTKEEFDRKLKDYMKWQYRSSDSVYKLFLVKNNDNMYLRPYCGSSFPEEAQYRVKGTEEFNWTEFSKLEKLAWRGNKAIFDVYDQLEFRWNEFFDYCWSYLNEEVIL